MHIFFGGELKHGKFDVYTDFTCYLSDLTDFQDLAVQS